MLESLVRNIVLNTDELKHEKIPADDQVIDKSNMPHLDNNELINESSILSGTPDNDPAHEDDLQLNKKYFKQINKKLATYFPLPSIVSALVIIGLLIISSTPSLNAHYQIPDYLSSIAGKIILLVIFSLVIIFDIFMFNKRKRKAVEQHSQSQKYIKKLWQSKKNLQNKANTFSGHADKLKMFISDKLLEYIEYDEKFLHFKGIASEVRHNGVISYDKVITALNKAIEQQRYLLIYEQNEAVQNAKIEPNQESKTTSESMTLDATAKYQNAIDAMRYLWSLLDLSTADNMSLHIGNQLIECEEHYCQLHLVAEKQLGMTQSIPLSPTFHPQVAALMTLSLFSEEPEIRNLLQLAKINQDVLNEPFELQTDLLNISLAPTEEILGNPNHVILLLENLIKNAQFFSQKVPFRQQTDRLALNLLQGDNYIEYQMYNRGPNISVPFDEIFKLGFSTRRSRKHHGKGLGLFFTQQIVKGYQGHVQVENIKNQSYNLVLAVGLASGESKTISLDIFAEEADLTIKKVDNSHNVQDRAKSFLFESDIPITWIKIEDSLANTVSQLENIEQDSELNFTELNEGLFAKWKVHLNKFRKQHLLTVRPLDIQGVLFKVKLPTANSRLEDIEPNFDS